MILVTSRLGTFVSYHAYCSSSSPSLTDQCVARSNFMVVLNVFLRTKQLHVHVHSTARTSPSQVNIRNAPSISSKQQTKATRLHHSMFDYTWMSLLFKMVIQGHNLIVLHAIMMQVVIRVHLIRVI